MTNTGLAGRVAVVTGAAGGIGRAIAAALYAEGASVAVADLNGDAADVYAAELAAAGGPGRALGVRVDISSSADVSAAIGLVERELGPVDVLVNNAGIDNAQVPAEHEAVADFVRVFDVNLKAPFLLSSLAARRMLEQGRGSIVNIASMLGLVASSPVKNASYCATKGGLVNLTRELAAQWARRGVRVNALAPGWFPSEMTAEMVVDDSSIDFVKRTCPMARFGEPGELDGALLFLASDASTYVTGQVLAVDGGWTAR